MAMCRRLRGGALRSDKQGLIGLCCWPVSIFPVTRFLGRIRFKPGRDLLRWYCPSREVGIDGAGGDDQSAIEFGSREIPGFRFGFKRLG